MMVDVAYAYPSYILFSLVVWLGLFLYRSDLRKEIVVMSVLSAPLGPLGDFFYRRDYYNLPILNGDLWILQSSLLGFFLGGVSAVLFAELFKRRYARRRELWKKPVHNWWFCGVLLLGIVVMTLGTFVFAINSVYVSLTVMLFGGAWIVWHRHDLIPEAVGNGVLLAVFFFVFYAIWLFLFPGIFVTQWHLENLSGIFFMGIPVEEFLFAFAWGFITGPAYEFVYDLRFCRIKRRRGSSQKSR